MATPIFRTHVVRSTPSSPAPHLARGYRYHHISDDQSEQWRLGAGHRGITKGAQATAAGWLSSGLAKKRRQSGRSTEEFDTSRSELEMCCSTRKGALSFEERPPFTWLAGFNAPDDRCS